MFLNRYKNKRNRLTPAIVIGLDSLQGLNSARILASYRIPVIAIAKVSDYHSCKTGVCDKIFYLDTSGEELINALQKFGPIFHNKPVLFPCQDKNVLNISRNRNKLKAWYHIILPPANIVEMMLHKTAFYNYAQKEGLPVPKTYNLNCREDAVKAANKLSFPCILKPSWRPEAWTKHTKVKASKANTVEEFLALYDHFYKWIDSLIIQEWIKGPDENHFTCNCYFNRKGEPLVTFTSRKLRQWLPQTGQACLSVECRNETVLDETLNLFTSVHYRGLAYLEMKLDEISGNYYIIEPNVGRPTGRASMAEASGVELLYTMYCDALGLPLPENRMQTYKGIKWIHLLRDIQAAIYHGSRGELTLLDWIRSVKGPKSYALFSKKDPAPFIHAIKRIIPVLLSRKERGADEFKPI